MAKNSEHNDLIQTIARPLWDKLVKHNQKRHPERVINELTLHRSFRTLGQDFTFEDFCQEIQLEITQEDKRN